MRVGILTAGGDCPGLNAAIRATARGLLDAGHRTVGLIDGYRGLVDREHMELGYSQLRLIVHLGGTILGTSSWNPYREPNGVERVRAALAEDPFDAIVAIGGDHTMGMTRQLHEDLRLPVVGIPKTIDNDVRGTDFTIGYDTAVEIATEAIDRLRTTAESHDRIMVVEVMGRDAGWIAIGAGIAGGADGIVVPEREVTVEALADGVRRRHAQGKSFSLIVVSEGARPVFAGGERRGARTSGGPDEYGHAQLGGIGQDLALELERLTGDDARVTTLGHLQRGGAPSASDRLLATRFGLHATQLVKTGRFGRMVAIRDGVVTDIPLAEVGGIKAVPPSYLQIAEVFFD